MHWLARMVRDAIKEMGVISVVNVPVAVVAAFVLRVGFFFAEGWLLLLEAAVLVIVGGAMELVSGSTWNKVATTVTGKDKERTHEDDNLSVKKALAHTLAGLLIFAEALILGLLTTS